MNRSIELDPLLFQQRGYFVLGEKQDYIIDDDNQPCVVTNIAGVDDHYVVTVANDHTIELPKVLYLAI